ncbi:MAG: hypothetical protein FWG40_12805 [Peptococcaceae bacterium]|nr:hypothetical protein [Peptococcaceae bacterium]
MCLDPLLSCLSLRHNGILEENTYDKNGQLLKIQESDTTLKAPKKQIKYEYKYDAEGNTINETKV